MKPLPTPLVGSELTWVTTHLAGFLAESPENAHASARFRGGQASADAALAAFDVTGYAARRNEVLPAHRRGASGLSPFIRHGLLPLSEVWDHVAGGPRRDVDKFRDELLWQEYARHVYARLGPAIAHPLRAPIAAAESGASETAASGHDPFSSDLACIRAMRQELFDDGWLVNQTRMWLASHWAVRQRADWRDGEDVFFTHLLDGSRAANRLGWQWTIGTATGKPYGFSRWQVEKRAPELCRECAHRYRCPLQQWPTEPTMTWLPEPDTRLRSDPDVAQTGGPSAPQYTDTTPEAVWLTAESLGNADPALAAHPTLPALFIFDALLLRQLRLSAKRLVFITECLAELAETRQVEVHLGTPLRVLEGRRVATTFAPVPGWRHIATGNRSLVAIHPWPWLRQPHRGPIASFSAWRR